MLNYKMGEGTPPSVWPIVGENTMEEQNTAQIESAPATTARTAQTALSWAIASVASDQVPGNRRSCTEYGYYIHTLPRQLCETHWRPCLEYHGALKIAIGVGNDF